MHTRIIAGLLLLSTLSLSIYAQQCWPKGTPPQGYNHTLIGCILFKNEERYLKEWLVYHQLAGFDHMYMYNHQSTDKSVEVLFLVPLIYLIYLYLKKIKLSIRSTFN